MGLQTIPNSQNRVQESKVEQDFALSDYSTFIVSLTIKTF